MQTISNATDSHTQLVEIAPPVVTCCFVVASILHLCPLHFFIDAIDSMCGFSSAQQKIHTVEKKPATPAKVQKQKKKKKGKFNGVWIRISQEYLK
jgi:hypothetical protein